LAERDADVYDKNYIGYLSDLTAINSMKTGILYLQKAFVIVMTLPCPNLSVNIWAKS